MWISVKDMLPGEGDRAIVYPNKYHDTATYNHYGKYAGEWTVDDENGYECEVVVTHWMPFPPPPNSEICGTENTSTNKASVPCCTKCERFRQAYIYKYCPHCGNIL